MDENGDTKKKKKEMEVLESQIKGNLRKMVTRRRECIIY